VFSSKEKVYIHFDYIVPFCNVIIRFKTININKMLWKDFDFFLNFLFSNINFKYFSVIAQVWIKGRVHCFSMQVVMNKCFLLNPEKNLAQIRLVVFENNAKTHTLIPKNDVTEPKARLLW